VIFMTDPVAFRKQDDDDDDDKRRSRLDSSSYSHASGPGLKPWPETGYPTTFRGIPQSFQEKAVIIPQIN
jgi:hypothetical protein